MKIIINRSDAIGDTLLTTPMAQKIKEYFPHAHITFIISPRIGDLLKNHPYIDDTWVLNDEINLYQKFKEYRPTHYFYVGGSYKPGLLALITGVPFRGGLKSRWPSFLLLNHGVRQKRSKVEMHEVEYNLELLSPLGIPKGPVDRKKYRPVLKLTEEEIENALIKMGLKDKKYIVVHPGMSGHTLNWPSDKYARLIEQIDETYPGKFTFVVSFTPTDGPYLKGLKDCALDLLFLDGAKLGLRNYMGILKNASIFIGPSTGPTHMANALGVKLVGIYSPIKVQSALRWAPYDVDETMTRVATPNVTCGETIKCAREACPYFECMEKIEVKEMVNHIKELL